MLETRVEKPLLHVGRLADRAVGGGLVLMLAATGSIFGLFFLCSVYLQNVLGTSPLITGLAFIPLAGAAGVGAHAAGHIVGRHGVRIPLASAFAIAAAGFALGGAQAASAISHAFAAAGILASLASITAFIVLPHARHFLAKLRLSPTGMPVH